MTEKEKQVQLQLLKSQHTQNINAIAKAKGEARKLRMEEIVAETDAYCVTKRETLAEIDRIRGEKYKYGYGTQRRQEIEEDAQREERKLSQQKAEHEAELHKINARLAAAMLELDNQQRDCEQWYEDQKAFIMSQKNEVQ